MSLHLPARQAANATRASIAKPSLHLRYLLPQTQRRHGWFDAFKWGSKKKTGKGTSAEAATGSALTAAMEKRKQDRQLTDRLSNRTQGSTIFEEELKGVQAQQPSAADPPKPQRRPDYGYSTMKEHMEMGLNPDPRWKVRFQRKKIMQMVRAEGKLSKEEHLKRTEKQLLSKSPHIPTSYKKLGPLARQIAGKTVDDAIAQMRYSKKKAAREVLWQLVEARAEAIAARGMGLGVPNGELLPAKRSILTKDGKKLDIEDPTRIYVDQSWVNKSIERGRRLQYHSRGRMSLMRRPTTKITVVLKEEKTRIRLHDERVAKAAKKAPWVHLPNRPVTAQRQYYSW